MHAGARVAPSPVALIIEQICVVSDMSGSRNMYVIIETEVIGLWARR